MKVAELAISLLKQDQGLEVEVEVGGSLWPTDCVTIKEVWYGKPDNRSVLILLDKEE